MRNSAIFKHAQHQDAIQNFQTSEMRPTLFGIQSIQRRRQRQGIYIPNQELQIQNPKNQTIATPSSSDDTSEIRKLTKICLKNAVVKTYLQSYKPEKSADSNKQILTCIIDQVSNEVRYPGKSIVRLPEIVTFVTLKHISIQNINILRFPTDICQSFPNLEEMDVSRVTGNSHFLAHTLAFQIKHLEFKDLRLADRYEANPEDAVRISVLPRIPLKGHTSLEKRSCGLVTVPESHKNNAVRVRYAPVLSQAEYSSAIEQALAFSMPSANCTRASKPPEVVVPLSIGDSEGPMLFPELEALALLPKESSRRGARRGSVFHKFGSSATTFV